MVLLHLFPDINKQIEIYKSTPNAVLLDVRTADEYAQGHIPGSINIPSDVILKVEDVIPDHETPIFVYCLRGTRSSRAVKKMKMLGYKNARSIGGIVVYKGLNII